jgi:4a-hydroxytetrahydrobiopterin dehydratase
MVPRVLDETTLQTELERLPAWRLDGSHLIRSFRCTDFSTAFGCMTRIAEIADGMDHHPDWSQSWNRVEITLTTHSVGGLTELDLALARAIDETVEAFACE